MNQTEIEVLLVFCGSLQRVCGSYLLVLMCSVNMGWTYWHQLLCGKMVGKRSFMAIKSSWKMSTVFRFVRFREKSSYVLLHCFFKNDLDYVCVIELFLYVAEIHVVLWFWWRGMPAKCQQKESNFASCLYLMFSIHILFLLCCSHFPWYIHGFFCE